MANYSFSINPIPAVENGHTFTGDNFCQFLPHTAILAGVTGLTFKNCNLTNCDAPMDAVFIGCAPRHTSFCSHEHPKWINKGLPVCADNCTHLVSTDTIIIDSVIVDTINHYSDKVVS